MSKVNKHDIEKKLNRAVEHAVPDLKDKIVENCKNVNVVYLPSTAKKSERKYKKEILSRIIVAAAAILLILNLGFIGLKGTGNNQVVTTIDIDVNPSIELKINSKDRVIEVSALNDDAIVILDGLELKGAQTNVAVNSVLGSMLSHGYLADDTRTILVSVNSKKESEAVALQESIAGDITVMLDTYSVEATVVSQVMPHSEETIALADEYGISNGKAAFVQKIAEADSEDIYDIELLTAMSVTELDTIWSEVADEEKTQVIELESTGIVLAEQNLDEQQADENINEDANEDEVDKKSEADTSMNDDESQSSENVLSENAVSDNSVSDNGISDNTVSDNSISTNAVSENEISNDSISENTVSSNNSISKNSVSRNSISKNSISTNSVSRNSISSNSTVNKAKR